MKNEQIKPKRTCQQCKYWGSVSGTHHSMCSFRWEASKHFPPQGPEHGIKERWWLFPFNYDPVWMIGECMEFNDGQDKENLSSVEYQLYRARQTGKTEAMVQSMVHQLKNNENVGVAGCKDPARILKRLTELGVSAEATVMSYWREPLDDSMLPGEQIDTGYLFKKKPVKCFECGEVIDPEWIKGDATLISCEKCIRKYLKEIKTDPDA